MPAKIGAQKGAVQKFTHLVKTPPHVEVAAASLAAVKHAPAPTGIPLRGPEPPVKAADSTGALLKNEAPRRFDQAKKFAASPAIRSGTAMPAAKDKRAMVVHGLRDNPPAPRKIITPVRPMPPAKNPAEAERNRRFHRARIVEQGAPQTRVVLAAGPRPIDIANGLVTPDRAVATMTTLPFKPGASLAAIQAPPDVAPAAPAEPVMTLPPTIVDGSIKNNPLSSAPSGEGIGRFAFLAGAVFVAWLVLGKAA